MKPARRIRREQELLQTLARVRRQDYLAGQLDIKRERRARERVEEQEKDEHRKEWEPMSRHFKRSFMADLYAQPDLNSQVMATQDAESLLRDIKIEGARPDGFIAPENPESN